jgi:putative membrane protein
MTRPAARRTLASLLIVGASLLVQPTLTHAQGANPSPPGSSSELRQRTPDANNDNTANPTGTHSSTSNAGDETAFLKSAISDNATEVEAARLAQDKAADPAVKQFAALVLRTAQARMQDATSVAQKHGVSTSQSPTAGDERALIDDLSNRSGQSFDETYLRAYIQDQRAALADYVEVSGTPTDDISAYADRHRGMLSDQLRQAQELAKRLNIQIEQS